MSGCQRLWSGTGWSFGDLARSTGMRTFRRVDLDGDRRKKMKRTMWRRLKKARKRKG
jgi:hypothetical protein